MGMRQLLIPHKTSSKQGQPEYGADMRAIEQWAMNVGGLYASLTGPGETESPGELQQNGPFDILGPLRVFDVSSDESFINTSGEFLVTAADIDLESGTDVHVYAPDTIRLGRSPAGTSFTANTDIEGGNVVIGTRVGTASSNIFIGNAEASGGVGFFGATPVFQAAHPTTLGDVITILTNLGLCS